MYQMYHNIDGPRIEEVIDPPSRSTSVIRETNLLQIDLDEFRDRCRKLTSRPDFNERPELIQNVIGLAKNYIRKWQRQESEEEHDPDRKQLIENVKTKLQFWESKKRSAENVHVARRDTNVEEEDRREMPRQRAFESQVNISRLHNSTRLNQQSYSSSHDNRNIRRNSEGDDDENMSPPRRQRSQSPSNAYHHSTMNHQRRDDTESSYRNHHTQNASHQRTHNTDSQSQYREQNGPSTSQNGRMPLTSQNVRMRSGKSSVTKTRSRKWRPGQRALEEIRKYQKSTDMLIQKAPFARLVHEIMREATSRSEDYRIRADALMALQEAAEAFMVEMFEGSVLICNHAKRVTLMPTDIQLYRRLCLRNLS